VTVGNTEGLYYTTTPSYPTVGTLYNPYVTPTVVSFGATGATGAGGAMKYCPHCKQHVVPTSKGSPASNEFLCPQCKTNLEE
jgi:hypothetical protein